MNRKIKFRVWNKIYQEMFYTSFSKNNNYDEKIYLTLDGQLRGDFKYCGDVDCSENYVIQQYTGLKDKNGVEIYEGDILIFRPCYDESLGGQFGNSVFSVYFADGAFRFGDQLADQEGASYYEIIGNIFENPELLK